MALPKVLYIREEKDGDDVYWVADSELIDVIDGDGPTKVGVYKLAETKTVRKVVAEG